MNKQGRASGSCCSRQLSFPRKDISPNNLEHSRSRDPAYFLLLSCSSQAGFNGLIVMELANPRIKFRQRLSSSDSSITFLVEMKKKTYFLKVHRGRGPKAYFEPADWECNFHINESKAYKRMNEQGLCDLGFVPKFYGTIEDLDPKLYQPHLEDFLDDEYPPKGIILEYIPNMTQLHYTNYTAGRIANFSSSLKKMHAVGVCHDDLYPRNMMIFKEVGKDGREDERIMWIDFNGAQTWDVDNLTERQKGILEEEDELMRDIGKCMKEDYEKGYMDRTYILYN